MGRILEYTVTENPGESTSAFMRRVTEWAYRRRHDYLEDPGWRGAWRRLTFQHFSAEVRVTLSDYDVYVCVADSSHYWDSRPIHRWWAVVDDRFLSQAQVKRLIEEVKARQVLVSKSV